MLQNRCSALGWLRSWMDEESRGVWRAGWRGPRTRPHAPESISGRIESVRPNSVETSRCLTRRVRKWDGWIPASTGNRGERETEGEVVSVIFDLYRVLGRAFILPLAAGDTRPFRTRLRLPRTDGGSYRWNAGSSDGVNVCAQWRRSTPPRAKRVMFEAGRGAVAHPRSSTHYGTYLADALAHWLAAGISIAYMPPMNEPDNDFGPAPCGQESPRTGARRPSGLSTALEPTAVGILADELSALAHARCREHNVPTSRVRTTRSQRRGRRSDGPGVVGPFWRTLEYPTASPISSRTRTRMHEPRRHRLLATCAPARPGPTGVRVPSSVVPPSPSFSPPPSTPPLPSFSSILG
ncbi:hypothetical protein B0H17DRAFT_1179724 [Mycena rosella]|uniref:Uncharacterized protein n=1 Tax=Mycena rosella TaxID=1033263 RepID=A0AAD7DGQ2_MYCRO|nr:hypothetical protein B0H17DRAFT_1179724 [Mycena rosella]